MRNELSGSTQGAPVLMLENIYPQFRYLQIQEHVDKPYFNPACTRHKSRSRPHQQRFEVSKTQTSGHKGTLVMIPEHNLPHMRSRSYVEAIPAKTWCWPPCQDPITVGRHPARSNGLIGDATGSADNLIPVILGIIISFISDTEFAGEFVRPFGASRGGCYNNQGT